MNNKKNMQEKNNMDFDRNNLLNILSENIQMMNKKVNGRIKNPENEKIKITQMKAVVYACKVYSDILKEQQITDIQMQLKRLEKSILTSNQEEKEEVLLTVEKTMKELEKIKT